MLKGQENWRINTNTFYIPFFLSLSLPLPPPPSWHTCLCMWSFTLFRLEKLGCAIIATPCFAYFQARLVFSVPLGDVAGKLSIGKARKVISPVCFSQDSLSCYSQCLMKVEACAKGKVGKRHSGVFLLLLQLLCILTCKILLLCPVLILPFPLFHCQSLPKSKAVEVEIWGMETPE